MKLQRNTKQRQLIYSIISNRHDHPTAEQIYLEAKSKNAKISRSTVYRNLNILVSQGKIIQTKLLTTDRFEAVAKEHYHFVCSKCDAVFDAPIDYNQTLNNSLAEKTGFVVLKHRLIFEGICSESLKKADN